MFGIMIGLVVICGLFVLAGVISDYSSWINNLEDDESC
jgi:hypothetical protein